MWKLVSADLSAEKSNESENSRLSLWFMVDVVWLYYSITLQAMLDSIMESDYS